MMRGFWNPTGTVQIICYFKIKKGNHRGLLLCKIRKKQIMKIAVRLSFYIRIYRMFEILI